jgi:acyl-CoA thioesterase
MTETLPRAEVIQILASRNPVYHMLGIELIEAVPGRSRFAMTVKTEHANSFDTFHGGLIFAYADLALGFTCNAADRHSVTADAKIDFLAPAHTGDRIIADAIETFRQGRNGIYDVRLWRESDGRTIAHVRGKMRIIGEPGSVVNWKPKGH